MRIPEEMPFGLSEIEQILWAVAAGSEHDSEYDGRIYTYCTHCHTSQENGERHDEDCLMLRARRALGTIWTDAVDAEERKHQEMLQEQHRRQQAEAARAAAKKSRAEAIALSNSITCEFCGDSMHKNALANHQLYTNKCLKAQGKSLPPKVDALTRKHEHQHTKPAPVMRLYTKQGRKLTPLCAHCKTPMPGAHPNKKFCSNTGVGNCKDAHHNVTNPRGFGQEQAELTTLQEPVNTLLSSS